MNPLRTPGTEVLRDLEHRLQQRVAGETRFDPYTRAMYNSDGSIHQVPPLGVVYPPFPSSSSAGGARCRR